MRDPIAIVAPSVDVDAVERQAARAVIALADAERAETKAEEGLAKRREETAQRRLFLGQVLVDARKAWPARGPKAKGWGEFLARVGVEERTAERYMQLAGHVGKVSDTSGDESETLVPTYREAGIDKRRRSEDDEDSAPTVDPGDAESPSLAGAGSKQAEPEPYDTDEYYTPAEVLEDARKVLVIIDLDPASCQVAQRRVQAGAFFTKADNGLTKEWNGRIWLNPPYSHPLATQFAEKLLAEYQAGRVTAAIVLMNASTDTGWFHAMAKVATICFTKGRLGFLRDDGKVLEGNRVGQVFFYLGPDPECFASVFRKYGLVGRLG